jgi:PHS family inorganic phosphate transporter-like MFS transporter
MSFHSLHSADERDSRIAVVLNKSRTVALEKVDRAPFSLFHVKVWLVAGAGFFTDAYDIFTISIVTTMIGWHLR